MLLSIATGSSLHYDMIGGETSELKDTVLDGLYYAGADDWKDNAAQSYVFAKTVTAGLGDQQITGYVREATSSPRPMKTARDRGRSCSADRHRRRQNLCAF